MFKRQFTLSALVLGLMFGGVSAQAAKPEPYRASSQVARNWASLTGVVSVGRIHKIETYERYESMAPCTISEEICKALEGKLEMALVDVARSKGGRLSWLVIVPTAQKLKAGDFIQFTFPETTKEVGQAVYEDDGRATTPPCRWEAEPKGVKVASEGVVCEAWTYRDLKVKW